MNDSSYREGMIEAIKKYGTFCSSHGDCSSCPMMEHLNGSMSCAGFAGQFPEQFLSVIDSENQSHSYYNEYCNRFPQSNMSVESLADVACRKAIFEGYVSCNGGDCVSCWKEHYTGDKTETGVVPDLYDTDLSGLFDSPISTSQEPVGNNQANDFTNLDFI